MLPRGGDRKSGEARSIDDSSIDQKSRAKRSGVSPTTQKLLDRLARERPDLLDRIRSGEVSVNKAAIEAGIKESAAETMKSATPS